MSEAKSAIESSSCCARAVLTANIASSGIVFVPIGVSALKGDSQCKPATITVEPREGVTLSQAIGAMRVWLDSEGIEPASFKPVALPSAKGIGFEVGFATLDAAASFSREFG